jgi:hypothetical protein
MPRFYTSVEIEPLIPHALAIFDQTCYGDVAAFAAHGSRFKICCELNWFPEAGSKYLTFVHSVELLVESRTKTAFTFADLYNNDHRSGRTPAEMMESRSGFPQFLTKIAASSRAGLGCRTGVDVSVFPFITAQ